MIVCVNKKPDTVYAADDEAWDEAGNRADIARPIARGTCIHSFKKHSSLNKRYD